MIEREVAVGAVLRHGGDARVLQLLTHVQELGPGLGLGGDAGGLKGVLVVEDAADIRLLGDGVQVAGPGDGLVGEALVAEAVVIGSLGHVGQVHGELVVDGADALVVVLDDVDVLLGFQGGGQHLVHVAALELDVDLDAGLGLIGRSGLLDHVGLRLAGGPHGPHGDGLAVALGGLVALFRGLGLGGGILGGLAGLAAGLVGAAGQHGQHHDAGQQQGHELLHFHLLPPDNDDDLFGRLRPYQL